MTKVASVALVLLVVAGGLWAQGRIQVAHAGLAHRVVCEQGAKRARIGGRARCLRVGMRCNVRFNATRPSYRRYGFLCSSWYGSAPTRLFRIAQPGAAPTSCDGIKPTPSSAHPGSQNAWVGGSPLWLGPYLDWRSTALQGIWRYRDAVGLRERSGWGVKFLWELLDSAGPATVSFTDLSTQKLLPVIVAGTYVERSTSPIFDPARPGQPDPFAQHPGAAAWGSTVLFPHAGCYRLDAHWSGGSTTIIFSFGR